MLQVSSLTGRKETRICDKGLTVADVHFWVAEKWKIPTHIMSLVCNRKPLYLWDLDSSIENLGDDEGNVTVALVLRMGTAPPEVGRLRTQLAQAIDDGLEAYKQGEPLDVHHANIQRCYDALE